MVYKNEGFKMFQGCLEKIATLTALRILNIRISIPGPNGQPISVSPDQIQLKPKAAEGAEANAEGADNAEAPAQEQLSSEGAKAAGLAGEAAASETNAITPEQQQAQQAQAAMPQSALPGTRPIVRRTYTNPQVAAAARQRAAQSGPKMGRNDMCWCGSGLKYKKCHGKDLAD